MLLEGAVRLGAGLLVLGPGCNMCRLKDLVPDGGVPMGKGPHGQLL